MAPGAGAARRHRTGIRWFGAPRAGWRDARQRARAADRMPAMGRTLLLVTLLLFLLFAFTLDTGAAGRHSYIFAWCGDVAMKSSDFLAVIDAEPGSPDYGKVVTTVPTGVAATMPHHTEVEMPAGGLLMANGFEAGKTWIFDLRRPTEPRIAASFGDLDGYSHPHTFFRLPDGNVLATFQYKGAAEPRAEGGGLVEVDDQGRALRSASAMSPSAAGELVRPYSVELLPAADRLVSTNTAMHEADGKSRTIQIWQFSTLKVLRTLALPPGPRGDEQYYPGEPRLAQDGRSILVHTFSCGLYLLRGVEKDQPTIQFVYAFPGNLCGVPLRLGHWWLATVPETHSLTVLDISDLEHPREVSRVTFDPSQKPHWAAVDASGARIVVDSDEQSSDHRLFVVDFDPKTGAAKLDERFRDPGSGRPGVSMDGKTWPHGFKGDAYVHGAVFTR